MDDDQVLVGGAAFETLCSELYERVDKLMKKSKEVNPLPGQIKETLDSLETLRHKKQRHKNDRETVKFDKNIVANGVKLLDACLEDPTWHDRVEYTKKLNDLDDSLKMVAIQLLLSAVDEGEIKNKDMERLLPGSVTKQQPGPAVDQPAAPPSSDMDDSHHTTTTVINSPILERIILLVILAHITKLLAVITMAVSVINVMFRVSSIIKVVDESIEYYYPWFGGTSAAETTYYDGKLLLVTSRWALLFLVRVGGVLVMIFSDIFVKFIVYAMFFFFSMMMVVGSVVTFRFLYPLYQEGSVSVKWPFPLAASTVFFLCICVRVMIFIDVVVEFIGYAMLFFFSMMMVVGSVVSFRYLYRRGFSRSEFRRPFLLAGWTVFFLCVCVLVFTSVTCHCNSSI